MPTPKQLQNLKGLLSDERRALLGILVADGWSYNQMRLTHGFHPDTVKRYYPQYGGMSKKEGAKLGAAHTHAFRNMRHT
jgi:hypothetical protein